MTPDQHVREAERLLTDAGRYDLGDPAQCAAAAVVTARAQVHATLAAVVKAEIPPHERCTWGDALNQCVRRRGHGGSHQLGPRP